MSPNNFNQGHALKIEWLVADVAPVVSPDRAERNILGMILGMLSANSGRICGRGATS